MQVPLAYVGCGDNQRHGSEGGKNLTREIRKENIGEIK
jgi:hypothetical protein